MLYTRGTVSTKSWEPIFNLRCRPYRVQEVVLDLLKQLTALRKMPCMLPSIDTLSLSLNRQLRVTFGDMDGLCDAIVSAPPSCSEMIVKALLISRLLGKSFPRTRSARGGIWGPRRPGYAVDTILQGLQAATRQGRRPDDQQMWAADRTRANHLQFTIWIDSLLPSSLAFEDDEMPVCVKPPSQPKPRVFKFVNYQPQKPLVPEHSAKPKRLHGGGIREYLVREYLKVIIPGLRP